MIVVSISNPAVVTDEENINMAVAIHCKETNKMEYKYKSYDPNGWKFYSPVCICRNFQNLLVYVHLKFYNQARILEAMSREVEVEGKKKQLQRN